jgi:hypothetical protein
MMTIRESHIIIKIDFDPELCGNFVALPSLRSGLLTCGIRNLFVSHLAFRKSVLTVITKSTNFNEELRKR